jgi:hypothetical protein
MKNCTYDSVRERGPSGSQLCRNHFSPHSILGVTLRSCACLFLIGSFVVRPTRLQADGTGKAFATPADAAAALGRVVNTTNRAELAVLFGNGADWLENPDPVQGARELAEFTSAFNATHRLVQESDSTMILEVGTNNWPFPIPLVKTATGWRFDTAAGREEILNRRIGRNELNALRAVRAYVEAQREYASRDRDGDEVLEYAQKITSSPGKSDGLYWPLELNGEMSPLGPMVAQAQSEGYFARDPATKTGPEPFQGYFFKILTRQGEHAPGGKYDYIINGNMIAGFAMVAWPAEYGESGVMTFIVNQQGRVYQRDLGERTDKIATKMRAYDPDPTWRISPD